jgi:CSLREA domain-containing protein
MKSPGPAVAGGVLIFVSTTADENGTNTGACSFREAIVVEHEHKLRRVHWQQRFRWNRVLTRTGTPVINITLGPLPIITDTATIDGGPNRVELRGPGGRWSAAHGLRVQANNVSVRRLVITNSADDGIYVTGANFSLLGSYVGVGADGTTPMPNQGFGVQITGANAVVGGATDGGDCSATATLFRAQSTGSRTYCWTPAPTARS